MVSSLNKVMLIGNLGRDPEIRTTSEGKEIANLSLATSDIWRDRATGEKKERTEWHRVVIFSEGLVSVVKSFAKKGSKVYVEGSLQTRKWNDSSGQEKYITEIVLQNFNSQLILLDNKNLGNGGGVESQNEYKKQTSKGGAFEYNDLDDEVPF